MQTFSLLFETLQMKKEENIAAYFLQVDEIVNSTRGIEVNINEESVMKKVLRIFPPIFTSKVLVLEDITNF